MTPETQAKKFFREMTGHKFDADQVGSVLSNMTAGFIMTMCRGNPEMEQDAVQLFAKNIQDRINAARLNILAAGVQQ